MSSIVSQQLPLQSWSIQYLCTDRFLSLSLDSLYMLVLSYSFRHDVVACISLMLIIHDAMRKETEITSENPIDSVTKALAATSNSPFTIAMTASSDDYELVRFAYGGQSWASNDQSRQSNLGNRARSWVREGEEGGRYGVYLLVSEDTV